jgi:NAD(P)-dependent dehydrogenase (short-subunit alcohol dehydrogenase family)
MYTVLISGAASGLGKAFLDHFAKEEKFNIIAIDHHSRTEVSKDGRIKTFNVDVSSPDSVRAFVTQIGEVPIRLFIHSAGIRGLVPSVASAHPENVQAAETLDVMDMKTMMETYQVNVVGTFILLQALTKNLLLAASGDEHPSVIIMGSRMGSVSYNSVGGGYAYRASKAALNAVVKSFSIDVPKVITTVLHPGRVATGLVASREEGAIEVEDSVKDMIRTIGDLSLADSGHFYDRFGDTIGW